MEPTKANQILIALKELDAKIAPEGLYASSEHRITKDKLRPFMELEFQRAIIPVVLPTVVAESERIHRGQPGKWLQHPYAIWNGLAAQRFAAIKVRKFGNTYRLDPRIDFENRWDANEVARRIKSVGQKCDWGKNGYLLITFHSDSEPFKEEFLDLYRDYPWDNYGTSCAKLCWQDPHGRGFFTQVNLWTPAAIE